MHNLRILIPTINSASKPSVVPEKRQKTMLKTQKEGKVLIKSTLFKNSSSAQLVKPGGVVVKHSGLWTRRREFESLPGYLSQTVTKRSRFAWKEMCGRRILNSRG